MKNITYLSLFTSVALSCASQAAIVYQDDFTSDPNLSTVPWYNEGTAPGTYDSPNAQVDYDHTGGVVQRLVNYDGSGPRNSLTQLYMELEISNFTGADATNGARVGFNYTNRSNTGHWAYFVLTSDLGDGTYELFFNNTSATLPFNNNGGWSGSLGAQSGIASKDNGATTIPIVVGGGVAANGGMRGFGVITAGNATVFPTTSFSLDTILVEDTLDLTGGGGGNADPVFTSDPVVKPDAEDGATYSDSIAGDAVDIDMDSMTFAKVSGPAWLSVAANGDITGTPSAGDVGSNSWTVSVTDSIGSPTTATLEIEVFVAGTLPTALIEWGEADPFSNTIVTSVNNFTTAPTDVYVPSTIALADGYYGDGSVTDKSEEFNIASTTSQAAQIQDNANYDRIRLVQLNDTGDQAWEAMVAWEDFLVPLGSGTVDTLSFGGFKSGSDMNFHFVIETAGGWYGTAADLVTGSDTVNRSVDVDAVDWYAFTPLNSDDAAVSNVAGAIVSPDFSTLTSAGVYVQTPAAGTATAESALQMGWFQLTAVGSGSEGSAPSFASDPINKAAAILGASYTGESLNGEATDSDLDTITYAKVSGPDWLTVASNGDLSGIPTFGDEGANSWTVSANDGNGNIVTATLEITVSEPGSNVAPIFLTDPITGSDANEAVAYSGSIAGTADDYNSGDTLTYAKDSGPAWLTVAANGDLGGTPSSGDVGANSWTVSVSDGNGGSDTATLDINVNAAGTSADVLVEWGEPDPFDATIVSSAAQFDNPPTNVYVPGTVAELDGYYGDGSVTDKSEEFNTAATNYQSAQIQDNANYDRIRLVQLTDAGDQAWEGMIVWEDFLTPLGAGTVEEMSLGGFKSGSGMNFHFIIQTAAGWYGTEATLVTSNGTTNLSIDVDVVDWYAFTPLNNDDAAVNNVTGGILSPDFSTLTSVGLYLQVPADGTPTAESALQLGWFQATASSAGAVGNPPVFGSDLIEKSDAEYGVAYTGSIASDASDPDPDTLSFSKVSGPAWLTIASNGDLSGTPSIADAGLNSWPISVSDGTGNSDSATLEIEVLAPVSNVAPVFASATLERLPAVQDEKYTGSIIADASDPNGDMLIFSITSGPAWLSMDSDGDFYGTPTSGNAGSNSWTVQVSDGSLTDTATLELDVDASAPTFTKSPNVIVIVTDDAGYADFGFTKNAIPGYNITDEIQSPTPHLDALASRGVIFSRAYVGANCQPTRAALVTGAYQQRIGNESVGNNLFLIDQQDGTDPDNNLEGYYEGLPHDAVTVWERMQTLGYTTGAIGKWHLGSTESTGTWANPIRTGNRPQHQGIDQFFGMWHGSRDFLAESYNDQSSDPTHALQPRYIREALGGVPSPTDPTDPDGYDVVLEYSDYSPTDYITNIFGDYAEDFVEDHHDDADPFFLYLAHPAPHKPWTNESPDYNDPRIAAWPDTVVDSGNPSDTSDNYRKQVMSMMITMDREIGDLIAQLEDPNGDGDTSDSIYDNTLIVFINDNGGVSGRAANDINGTNNGVLSGYKGSSHEGGIRVPMIVAGAGIDPSVRGTVFDEPVHGTDILPTAFELAGGSILTPDLDYVDGVNILPTVNAASGAPKDVIVHKWRGSFAVIKDEWKLQNSRNIWAAPEFYELFDLDGDISEITDEAANEAALVAELKRHLTDYESVFDKPRYAILSNTIESEPLNVFDHHVFRPDQGVAAWSGGVDAQEGTGGTRNWYKAGTTVEKYLFNSDSFPGTVIEFPVHTASYTASKDLRRKTGMHFMLNKIILSGGFAETSSATATIDHDQNGDDNAGSGVADNLLDTLLFTNDLSGNGPQIALDADNTSSGNFTFDLDLNLMLYNDLTLSGDGDAALVIDGKIVEYEAGFYDPRGLVKDGTSTVTSNGLNTYTGDTTVNEGVLSLSQINTSNESSTVTIAASGAALNLAFVGTDTVDKLYIGGAQQAAGVYGSLGSGAENEIAQITGSGTLTVSSGTAASGFSSWASTNAPGQTFDQDHDGDGVENGVEHFMGESGNGITLMPTPDAGGTVTWPMGAAYSGTYGTDYVVEVSTPDLNSWTPALVGDVVITPGVSVSFTLPIGSITDPFFTRLVVNEN
ncbi:MAG: sulfatase-like hydrolase/transferase [Opitutaceae bacterium]